MWFIALHIPFGESYSLAKREDDFFCEYLRDVKKDNKGANKRVARHLPQHSTLREVIYEVLFNVYSLLDSTLHMAICLLSFFNGGTESKNLEQFFFLNRHPHFLRYKRMFLLERIDLCLPSLLYFFVYLLLRQQVSTNIISHNSTILRKGANAPDFSLCFSNFLRW